MKNSDPSPSTEERIGRCLRSLHLARRRLDSLESLLARLNPSLEHDPTGNETVALLTKEPRLLKTCLQELRSVEKLLEAIEAETQALHPEK